MPSRNMTPAKSHKVIKVRLTERLLRQLDRQRPGRSERKFIPPQPCPNTLARFARHGGPDLHFIRGWIVDAIPNHRDQSVEPTPYSPSRRAPRVSGGSVKLFDSIQDLQKYGIHHHGVNTTTNLLKEFREGLKPRRASLSASAFSERDFRLCKTRYLDAMTASEVVDFVQTTLVGATGALSTDPTVLDGLRPIATDNPKPQLFDAANVADLYDEVDKDLEIQESVLSQEHSSDLVAPNFFLTAPGLTGSSATTAHLILLGSTGAEAMRVLQNYGIDDPIYDGNAYSCSVLLAGPLLQIFAHYVTEDPEDGHPQYHTILVGWWNIVKDIFGFIDGVTAFRNARDLMQEHRDRFIEEANSRAVG